MGDDNNAVVDYETPVENKSTEPAWIHKFGEDSIGMGGWNYAPNTPIIVDGDIITTCNKEILKVDTDTGEIKKKGDLAGTVNWGYTAVTYVKMADGSDVYFCPLAGGVIQAVKETEDGFDTLWTFKAKAKDDKEND